TVGFCREEGGEDLIQSLWVDAFSSIFYRGDHSTVFVRGRANNHFTLVVADTLHRVRAVRHEVQHDLLQLDAVANDPRQVLGQLELHDDTSPRQLASQDRDHFADQIVDVDW